LGTGKPAYPETNGETVITRYLLLELLDKLDQLLEANKGKGGSS
jgi:hypothetical protein